MRNNNQSLAVAYRPQTFEQVAGQQITVELLKKAVEKDKFSNAILLAGSSGCGKTTLARIFAKAINKGLGSPIELNAADSNGVDDIRAVIESSKQRAIVGEYKVFIIDECHMITKEGWSAFLKGIEECPKYTVLIFCTTDPQKIPETILNRVQRYAIRPISRDLIKSRLEYICNQEGFKNYTETCDLISKSCQGGMRDAIAMLEQCADYNTDLSFENSKNVLGEFSFETMFKLTWAIQNKDSSNIINIVESVYGSGKDLKTFINNYLDFIIDLEKYILFNDISLTNIPTHLATEENQVVQFTVANNNLSYYKALSECILNLKQLIKYDVSYKSTIEVVLMQFSLGA